ncbi:hypothetical protein RFI_09134 [Reticulomyxa filosa]|uniref:Uncharacterized protein n=1 Tax=Reticulomyxa filosa TaxID=46433 RepID=X6NRN8_RETFI|nr:hypothetical protein RFI_09134 [Reticulomyxa filosa]|eukprot:ETO27997.1 hypothetical protein RFI_09134 [Reticulomyxa filosa]
MANNNIGENIIDTTVDATLANMRNDERQKQLQQLIDQNKKIQDAHTKLQQQQYAAGGDLPEGAEAVTIVEEVEVPAEGAQVEQKEPEPKPEPDPFINPNIIYNSFERPTSYYLLRWLWCGCFEPRYKITTTYVIGEEWHGCCCGGDSGERCCIRVEF